MATVRLSPRKRAGRGPLLYVAALWLVWFLLALLFELVRGIGDDISPARPLGSLERALFLGTVPSEQLQAWIYARDVAWFDYLAFLAHGLWFGVPFAFGLVVTIYRRDLLLRFFGVLLVTAYIAAVFYCVMPVEPPWMEAGIPRVLYERNFGGYGQIDPNELAAFPSLHAALPFAVGLFLIREDRRLRFFGRIAVGYSFAVGFAIVYMGEHWVLDVVAGYAVAFVAVLIMSSARIAELLARLPGAPAARLLAWNERWAPPPQPVRALPEPALAEPSRARAA
jgi:membrane-associated phospholipid phosphatase